jgi:hypothetical protein
MSRADYTIRCYDSRNSCTAVIQGSYTDKELQLKLKQLWQVHYRVKVDKQ